MALTFLTVSRTSERDNSIVYKASGSGYTPPRVVLGAVGSVLSLGWAGLSLVPHLSECPRLLLGSGAVGPSIPVVNTDDHQVATKESRKWSVLPRHQQPFLPLPFLLCFFPSFQPSSFYLCLYASAFPLLSLLPSFSYFLPSSFPPFFSPSPPHPPSLSFFLFLRVYLDLANILLLVT